MFDDLKYFLPEEFKFNKFTAKFPLRNSKVLGFRLLSEDQITLYNSDPKMSNPSKWYPVEGSQGKDSPLSVTYLLGALKDGLTDGA